MYGVHDGGYSIPATAKVLLPIRIGVPTGVVALMVSSMEFWIRRCLMFDELFYGMEFCGMDA